VCRLSSACFWQDAHGYINLDETGTLKAAAEPHLQSFEKVVTKGHELAANGLPLAAEDGN
jgi:hypothetical protein